MLFYDYCDFYRVVNDMRLIDADELIKEMKQECNGKCKSCVYYTFLSDDVHCGLIDAQPTVEAVPAVLI